MSSPRCPFCGELADDIPAGTSRGLSIPPGWHYGSAEVPLSTGEPVHNGCAASSSVLSPAVGGSILEDLASLKDSEDRLAAAHANYLEADQQFDLAESDFRSVLDDRHATRKDGRDQNRCIGFNNDESMVHGTDRDAADLAVQIASSKFQGCIKALWNAGNEKRIAELDQQLARQRLLHAMNLGPG